MEAKELCGGENACERRVSWQNREEPRFKLKSWCGNVEVVLQKTRVVFM